jgi:hypothetical protein
MKDEDRVDLARWLLDRNIAWIAAAEAKAGFIVALDTAMFAGLATAYSDAKAITALQQFGSVFAALLLAMSVLFCAVVVRSQTHGPASSLIFFGRISKRSIETYRDAFKTSDSTAWITDFADQIHRNAEIATEKYEWVRRATVTLMFAGPFWALAVVSLVRG